MNIGTQITRDMMKAHRYPMPWTPLTHWAEKFGILRLQIGSVKLYYLKLSSLSI